MGEGPAISNIGSFQNMSLVTFVDNYFVCSAGEFLEYVNTTVSARTVWDFQLSPGNDMYSGRLSRSMGCNAAYRC